MKYQWKHLCIQTALLIAQLTTYLYGHLNVAIALGICQIPFIIRILYTIFSKEKIG